MTQSTPLCHPSVTVAAKLDSPGAKTPRPAIEPIVDALPWMISVMCPAGFTASSMEGLTLDRPLFARVTYRRV